MKMPWSKKEEPKKSVIRKAINKAIRYFDAADTDRLTFGWDSKNSSIDAVLRKDLDTLRSRCREQGRNNDYARRFMSLLQTNVVGPDGIKIQAQIKNQAGDLDTPANDAVEYEFAEWAEDADVAGLMNFAEIQRLIMSSLCTDGEFLCQFHYTEDGVKLESVDPARIATDMDRSLDEGAVVRLGVEYKGPRPVAVWLNDIDDRGEYEKSQAKRVPFMINGKPNIYHIFVQEHVGQCRGIPFLSTALYRLKMIKGYEHAAIVAARVGAAKAGFYYNESGNEYVGDDETEDGSLLQDIEPGTFEQLPAGTKFQAYDPTYPHEQFEPFLKRSLMGAASGMGVGYNAVASDPEGVSYSTLRQFELENREGYKVRQQLIIKFAKMVRDKAVLPMAQLQNKFGNRDISELIPATYQGRRWDWVDPQKEQAANQIAILMGITSVSQIIRDSGKDPEKVFAEIAAERELLKAAGVDNASKQVSTDDR